MKPGESVEFNQSKHFKFIRELGSGGTGVTHLFKDETTDSFFAIKKYQPSGGNVAQREELYERFVDEIKILFKLSHPNIVRIYNYYLYPKSTLGYLQMEYIEGVAIDEYVDNNFVDLNQLFRNAIDAFICLESNNILHRDIRPANIMVDNDGEIKIIDFGFGKILDSEETENSIILNWPATEFPNEVLNDEQYSVETEIYFLGYLFRKLIKENNIEDFKFGNILEKMCEADINNRYESFESISFDIAKGVLLDISFTEHEKSIYLSMAENLTSLIIEYNTPYSPVTDVSEIMSSLENIIRSSSLEEYIQDKSRMIKVFINNGCSYSIRKLIRVKTVKDFYKLLLDSNKEKKRTILENLKIRLSLIKTKKSPLDIMDDELPF